MNFKRQLPKISVITPNYNYANYIGQTIESVINQDYENVEHIIVDDGSTDKSVEIIQEYVNKYPEKIRLITQENKGQSMAINVGFKNSTGDILAWINSDDWYCKNVFKKVVEIFNQNPDVDIVFGDYYNVDSNGKKRFIYKNLKFNYFIACMIGFGQVMASNTVFWKKELLSKIGYIDESFSYAMDSEFFARLTRNANIKKVNYPVANYRFHSKCKTAIHRNSKLKRYSEEMELVFVNTYNSLKISKFIPIKYSWIIRKAFRFYRIFLRSIKGHYFPIIKFKLLE